LGVDSPRCWSTDGPETESMATWQMLFAVDAPSMALDHGVPRGVHIAVGVLRQQGVHITVLFSSSTGRREELFLNGASRRAHEGRGRQTQRIWGCQS
jgi:hypothetical protein